MISRATPGYAIGGLSGGEDKQQFWKIVNHCTNLLPQDKPRYLMGVGYVKLWRYGLIVIHQFSYPVDLVICSALGVDMYDCVYPTRTAVSLLLCCHGNITIVIEIWHSSGSVGIVTVEE